MALPTIANDTPDHDLLKENTYPLVNLEANPLTANLAAPFVLLQDDLLVSLSDENKLLLAVARAEARAWMLDFQIDLLVDALKHGLLVITNGDTTADAYTHYFKKPPAEVKEPILAEELATVAGWLPSLKTSGHPALKEIYVKLEPLVAQGVPAMNEVNAANQALLDFYEVGTRFALVQKMNAVRKLTHGLLGQLVHDHPELGLPVTFPDSFFYHDMTRRKKVTPESIDGEIATLKKKITALEIKKEKLITILAAQKKAGEKKASGKRAERIAKLQKEAAETAAELAALQAAEAAGEAETP